MEFGEYLGQAVPAPFAWYMVGENGVGAMMYRLLVFVGTLVFGAVMPAQQLCARNTDHVENPATAMPDARPATRALARGDVPHEKPSGAASSTAIEDPSAHEMVKKVRAALPAQDLAVTVALDPPRSSFVEGDLVSIGFSTKEDAYAAVLVYSGRRSVTMLYPNDYAEGRTGRSGVVNWVGGERKFVVKVVPPFGVDTVHVLAFRNADDLRSLLDKLAIKKKSRVLFTVDSSSLERSVAAIRLRGLAAGKRDNGMAAAPKSGWGDAVVAIHTRSPVD